MTVQVEIRKAIEGGGGGRGREVKVRQESRGGGGWEKVGRQRGKGWDQWRGKEGAGRK